MKKFEEEFDNLMRAFVDYHDCFDFDTEKCYLELKKEFIEKYGKKHQPEIPEFVAEYLKRAKNWNKARRFSLAGALKGTDFIDDKTQEWLEDWPNQEIFAQAWINGYTVAKEKRFYLKNKLTGLYLYESKKGFFEQENLALELTSRCDYTQQEIDSMAAESYEQIEVEE